MNLVLWYLYAILVVKAENEYKSRIAVRHRTEQLLRKGQGQGFVNYWLGMACLVVRGTPLRYRTLDEHLQNKLDTDWVKLNEQGGSTYSHHDSSGDSGGAAEGRGRAKFRG